MPLSILDIARRIAYFFAERGVTPIGASPRVTLTFDNIQIAHHALHAIEQEFAAMQMYPAKAGFVQLNGNFKINGVVFKIEPLE